MTEITGDSLQFHSRHTLWINPVGIVNSRRRKVAGRTFSGCFRKIKFITRSIIGLREIRDYWKGSIIPGDSPYGIWALISFQVSSILHSQEALICSGLRMGIKQPLIHRKRERQVSLFPTVAFCAALVFFLSGVIEGWKLFEIR